MKQLTVKMCRNRRHKQCELNESVMHWYMRSFLASKTVIVIQLKSHHQHTVRPRPSK